MRAAGRVFRARDSYTTPSHRSGSPRRRTLPETGEFLGQRAHEHSRVPHRRHRRRRLRPRPIAGRRMAGRSHEADRNLIAATPKSSAYKVSTRGSITSWTDCATSERKFKPVRASMLRTETRLGFQSSAFATWLLLLGIT